MRYCVYGPIEMTRCGAAVSRERRDKKAFWDSVEEKENGLSDACGCYVFVVRGRAWYIGMAEKQGFKKEIFQHHKLLLYSEALQAVNGRAEFLFLAKVTPGDRFAKPSRKYGHRDIRFLEKLMIGSALRRNPRLRNIKDTKLLREMHVSGLLNREPGEGRAITVQALRSAIGV
jgi:hypothetical protein